MQITDTVREFNDDGSQELVLTMVASPEDVDASSKRFFADIQQREHKGFRKGKAPRTVLEQSVGGHANAMGGVAEVLINELAVAKIDEADIIFIDEPQFNVDGMLEEGKPFSFSVSGKVAPVMKLTSYAPVQIEMPPDEATKGEIDQQIADLRDFYHSFENIADECHVAEMGDFADLKVTVTDKDDKVVAGLASVKRLVGLGEGTMPTTFDEQVVGSKVGDMLEFDFDAKNPDGTSDFGDDELHAVVDVLGFRKRLIPEIDDAFAVKVGCVDVDDMYKQIERSINIQKSRELPKIKVDRVIDEAIARLDGEVPDYYVDFIRQDVGREFMQNLEKSGTNLQQWMLENSVNGDDMKEDIANESRRRAAIDCALEAIFVEAGLEITDADIDAMFEGDDDTNETRQKWEDANRMSDLRKMARQTKATEWLVDNAEVTTVDLTEFA